MSNSDDKDIWQAYAKKVKRTSFKGKKEQMLPTLRQQTRNKLRMQDIALPEAKLPPVFIAKPVHDFTTHVFDKRMGRRLRDGTIDIEACLDMHGMTQQEAYAALQNFMTTQIRTQRRIVLVITGKGRGGDGILRSHLIPWLQSLPLGTHVMAVHSAAIRHGGQGAFYVMLRRSMMDSWTA